MLITLISFVLLRKLKQIVQPSNHLLPRAATQNDADRYKAICQTLITKTQVENDYNKLRSLFINNNLLLEAFQQENQQGNRWMFPRQFAH